MAKSRRRMYLTDHNACMYRKRRTVTLEGREGEADMETGELEEIKERDLWKQGGATLKEKNNRAGKEEEEEDKIWGKK